MHSGTLAAYGERHGAKVDDAKLGTTPPPPGAPVNGRALRISAQREIAWWDGAGQIGS